MGASPRPDARRDNLEGFWKPQFGRNHGFIRCVIPLKENNLRAWLTPDGKSVEELYALLDDRERPYYQHQLAA
jgi:hypothetical protein